MDAEYLLFLHRLLDRYVTLRDDGVGLPGELELLDRMLTRLAEVAAEGLPSPAIAGLVG